MAVAHLTVLFLRTGNAARGIIAESTLNAVADGRMPAPSARAIR